MQSKRIKQLVSLVALALVTDGTMRPAAAGLKGQPKPSPSVVAKAQEASATLARFDGDKNAARPELLTLVEANATADLTDVIAPALDDANTYTSLIATLDDALQTQTTDASRAFVRYNRARISLLRARALPSKNAKDLPLLEAEQALKGFDAVTSRDPAYWELMGDVQAEKGEPDAAAIAYKKIITSGGNNAEAQFKTAQAYARANRFALAKAAFDAGIRADAANGYAGGKRMKHLLYQGLASLYYAQGDEKNALDALLLSAKVTQDTDAPYRLRLDVARRLLSRGGHAREIQAYADAALKLAPDDDEAKTLREGAAASARP